MSPFAIAALAVTMSVDSFAASVGRGASIGRPRLTEALRTGVIFGVIEALTPVVGWLAGVAASRYVESFDHWIAFVLLTAVGLHTLYGTLRGSPEEKEARNCSFCLLIATAVGTSLDAMAVGVSLAFLQVNIVVIACAIGFATFVMSTGGMMAGNLIGTAFGRWAERLGGLALMALGTSILVSHLSNG